MAEYYIRQPDSQDARGPFDVEKLSSLVEANQVTPDTLFFDEAQQAWVPVSSNPELKRALFPERTKLSLRAKADTSQFLNKEDEGAPSVTVHDMLAAAEGKTEETKHLKRQEEWQARAAALMTPALGLVMLLSAVSNLWPNIDTIREFISAPHYSLLIAKPLLVLGIFDLLLALVMFLGATQLFGLLRFRLMLGLGFFCYLAWAFSDHKTLIAVAAGSLGAFIVTLTANVAFVATATLVGLAGMGALAYFSFIGA